ncbi:MAG: YfhO family protein [Enhydrobacter sp.]
MEHLHWLVAVVGSLAYSLVYTSRQLGCVAPGFAANLPVIDRVQTIAVVFLTLLSLYAVALTLLVRRSLFASILLSLGFLAGVAAAWSFGSATGIGIFFCASLGVWVLGLSVPGVPATRLKWAVEYVLPFIVLTIVYWFVIETVSPRYFEHAATRSSEAYLASSSSAIRSYLAPECYSFSSFLHQYWGAIQEVPTGLTSMAMGLIGFFHLFSSWEATSFYKAFTLVVFAVYVGWAYFLYLFLRAVKVDAGPALASACVLVVGNRYFINVLPQDLGWLGASFLGTTMSLWALALALKRGSILIGMWSGIALAAPFYVLAPHPEFVIYSVGIYIIVALTYLALPVAEGASRPRAFVIYLMAAVAMILVSLAYLEPIVWQTVTKQMLVMGEETEVPPTFAYTIPFISFYVVLLVVCAGLVSIGYRKEGRILYPFVAFFLIAAAALPLSIPGVPTAARAVTKTFGWTMHLIPQDRILAYMGMAALVLLAIATDALLRIARRTECWRRSWFYLVNDGSKARAYLVSGLPSIVGLVLVAFVAVKGGGGDQQVAVRDASRRPVYESLGAVLGNSLLPAEQQASIGYLRQRLLAFERDTRGDRRPTVVAARTQYQTALKAMNVSSVAELPHESVRLLTLKVFEAVDGANAAMGKADTIPENVDGALAMLDDPYRRTMAVTSAKYQTAFLGAARRVTNAHNNSMMYDNRFMLGQRAIQALFIYPRDVLPQYMDWLNFGTQQGNYFISNARPPWHYETKDIIGNPFRRLLGIAGVGVYLAVVDAEVERALANPATELVKSGPVTEASGTSFVALRDERAYDTAYLANVVGEYDPVKVAELERAAETFFLHRAGQGYRLALADFLKVLDPAVDSLMALKGRHDALLERTPSQPSPPRRIDVTSPGERGGKITIDGIVGPRAGFRVDCPDAECTLVYNMALLPGWSAYVDGRQAEIVRANYAFMAVNVPKGAHYVVWIYRTAWQTLAEIISITAFLTLLVMTWLGRSGAGRAPGTALQLLSGKLSKGSLL